MLLSALPADLIDQIARYLVKDELFNLRCVGNPVLSSKVRQVSVLTIVPKNARSCNWEACLPFLKGFPKVRELTLRAWSRQQRSHPMLEPGILPSNLISLSLDFYCAMDIMTRSQAWNNMSSLTYLCVSQECSLFHETKQKLILDGFPASLRQLSLQVTSDNYYFLEEDLNFLPLDLELFDSTVSIGSDEQNLSKPRSSLHSHIFENRPPTITYLAIKGSSKPIDISHIAPALRHFQVYGGQIIFDGKLIDRLTSPKGTPIRDLLPRLHTLILPTALQLCWEVFETLPLSLTRLQGNFSPTGSTDEAIDQTWTRLNSSHVSEPLDRRPGAPMMIREIKLATDNISFLKYLHLFPALEGLRGPFGQSAARTKDIPRKLRAIFARSLEGPIALLPPSLKSINCVSMATGCKNMASDVEMVPQLPPLTHLSIDRLRPTGDLVSMLPVTLKSLSLQLGNHSEFEALGRRANEHLLLPQLSDLEIFFLPGTGNFPVDVSILPLTIRSLKLHGAYVLPPASSPLSIEHHPRIQTISLMRGVNPREVLPILPKQATAVHITLSDPIYMGDPEMMRMLRKLPPGLLKLKIELEIDGRRSKADFLVPAQPFEHKTSLFSHLLSARSGAEIRLLLIRAMPRWLSSWSLRFLASERLFMSCLPRSLSKLTANITPTVSIVGPGYHEAVWRRIFAAFWLRDLNTFLTIFMATRLPLIGLLFSRQYKPGRVSPMTRHEEYDRHRIAALPPRLVKLKPMASFHWDFHKSLNSSDDVEEGTFSLIARVFFYTANICAWVPLLSFLAIKRQEHPIAWAYQWSHIIGSAIAIPLQLYSLRRSLPHLHKNVSQHNTSLKTLGFAIAIFVPTTCFLWLTSYASAVSLGYSASRWSIGSRIVAGIGALLGESVIRFFSGNLFCID